MKKELLAPAGDIEAGYAALYYGADAVYLGLKHFSARSTAANFTEEELNDFTGFAHSKNKKVYVALNTVIQESELPQLLASLDICSRCHIDAIIIQDIGVARIIRKKYPNIEMHASTQMAVHNKEGALALKNMGFSRVVLARELSLSEIKDIASIPELEIEIFIHGALCYSYSGLCLFSSLEYGHSANRGKCLYPCRSEFDGEDSKKHYFSMKDLALKGDILDIPAISFKIEGRKKNALYVAAVTDYYRRILDGKGCDRNREENIKQIFSRPWSKFYFHGKDKTVIEPDFIGHRGLPIGKIEQISKGRIILHIKHDISRHDGIQIDVPGQEKPFGFSLHNLLVNGRNVFEAKTDEKVVILLPPHAPMLQKGLTVYLASSSHVKGDYDYKKPKSGAFLQKQLIQVHVSIEKDKITASSEKQKVEIKSAFIPAINIQQAQETIYKVFSKTGGTKFELENLTIDNPEELFVPISLLNTLRRDLYAKITPEIHTTSIPVIDEPYRFTKSGWIIRTDRVECLSQINIHQVDEIIILLSPDFQIARLKDFPKNKIRFALPAVERCPIRYTNIIHKLLDGGYKKWEIGNWWGLSILPKTGIDISFDYTIYTLNTQAIQEAKEHNISRITLSVEDCLENMQIIAAKSPLPIVMPIFQDVPLFTSSVCLRRHSCQSCSREEKWFSFYHKGNQYSALSKDCQTMLFNQKSLCYAAEAPKVSSAFYRVDFVYKDYSPEAAAAIWNKVHSFEDIEEKIKGNLLSHGGF